MYANYGLHYVGGVPLLSADYYGMFAERLAAKLGAAGGGNGPGFVGMMSNGASGDVNNVNTQEPQPKRQPGEQCRLVAESVAAAAKTAIEAAKYRSDLTLAIAEREVEFRVRKPTPEELARAKTILGKAAGRDLKGMEEFYARETVLLAAWPDAVKLKLQAIRVGDLGIVAVPCEVFAEIGLEIKKKSPLKSTFLVSLANGYNGYLPTPAQHALGGYETWRARSSYLETTAAETIATNLLDLLALVAKK